ncbi:hypothetical protein ES703_21650 [subsurface metagenome]|nr:hypothetical protein [bacterium]
MRDRENKKGRSPVKVKPALAVNPKADRSEESKPKALKIQAGISEKEEGNGS